MAADLYQRGYGDGGLVVGHGSSQDYNEKSGSDLEVGPSKSKGSLRNEDPFGDETDSEVKYRTLAWW